MATLLQVAITIGLGLSAYSLYVEHMRSIDPSFKAICDISEVVSCSKVFESPYGRAMSQVGMVRVGSAFDLPNAAIGIVFYSFMLLGDLIHSMPGLVGQQAAFSATLFMMMASLASVAFSVYLFYVLILIMEDYCVLCFSTHMVNLVAAMVCLDRFCREGLAPAPVARPHQHDD